MTTDLTGIDNLLGGNKINPDDIFSFSNKKIIMALWTDEMSLNWVHHLTSDIEFLCLKQNKYLIFYSKKFDLYFFYYLELDCDVLLFEEDISKLNKNNFIHIVIAFGPCKDRLLTYLSSKKIKNLKHSLLFTTGDPFLDKRPHELRLFKNLSYIFSSTNIVKDYNPNDEQYVDDYWIENNSEKFYIDYKYSLSYYYFRLGLNFSQKGIEHIEISNRKNEVFLYSKSNDNHSPRNIAIKTAIDSNKIYEKCLTNDDLFKSVIRHDNYHLPFIIDYNTCKFNLIMETNKPSKVDNEETYEKHNIFLSEKTLKGLFVPTPTYILLMPPTYNCLKEYGFYLLNSEFEKGEYDYSNYERFCDWLKNCSDEDFDRMYDISYQKSKHNKELLEKYIYSDKIKEINLLTNMY